MLKKLWLIFAQTVTVGTAAVFAWKAWGPAAPAPQPAPAVQVSPAAIAPARLPAQGSWAPTVAQAAPSVVTIDTTQSRYEGGESFFGFLLSPPVRRTVAGLGSGIIIRPDGLIATNWHVVEDAEQISVRLNDGRRLAAKLVGSDPETDLALLKVEAEGLPALVFGRSESLKPGDIVLAIGNPYGVGQTVTAGIVSAMGPRTLGDIAVEDCIQTDAAINHGNSGGALINTRGELVGINSAIFATSEDSGSIGIGFAIPTSLAANILDELAANGKIARGWLGVRAIDVTAQQARRWGLPRAGVAVAEIYRGSPAARFGLRVGDILLKIDGKPVSQADKASETIRRIKPDQKVRIELLRERDPVTVELPLAQRPLKAKQTM